MAIEFKFKDEFDAFDLCSVSFMRMNSPFYAGEKWAVRKLSCCLNKAAEWEYEPIPSSRDDEFYARCRFDSVQNAMEIYNKTKDMEKKHD